MSPTGQNKKSSAKNGAGAYTQQQRPMPDKGVDTHGTPQKATDAAVSDHEQRKESSKLSKQAIAAQKKAHELRQAANGAADPDERQHLMEEAINTQIEAETFGKTAKYLQSGTFQGMAVGTGIGTVPGLTLGTLTGTLVGGTVSLVTGGLGGALGAATGAIHGPFWNMGKLAGKGIRKITGDLPGWKATTEQKATLEKMIGQVNEQEPPSGEDLKSMAEWDSQPHGDDSTQTWAEYGASYLPSGSTAEEKPTAEKRERVANSGAKVKQKNVPGQQSRTESQKKPEKEPSVQSKHELKNNQDNGQMREQRERGREKNTPRYADKDVQVGPKQEQSTIQKGPKQGSDPLNGPRSNKSTSSAGRRSDGGSDQSSMPSQAQSGQKRPRKLHKEPSDSNAQPGSSAPSRRAPRKLETRSGGASSSQVRKVPRKLEVRKEGAVKSG